MHKPRGMERVSYGVMDALSREVDFRIVTPRPFGPGVEIVRQFDPNAKDFAYKGRFGWRTFPEFSQHVREAAQDCSHVWITGTCATSLAAARRLDLPVALSHHYHHFEGKFSWLKWRLFYELLTRNVNVITYPTQFTRNEALRIAPWLKARSRVVPNAFTVDYTDEPSRIIKKRESPLRSRITARRVHCRKRGWLIHRKRFDIFLKTAAAIKRQFPNSYFVICGGGQLESQLKKLAYTLGIAESVRFDGWVQQLNQYYQAWDVLLFNSDFDALGCTPLEAASHGCLVVASVSYGGLDEFIESGINGYLYGEHDIAELATAVCALRRDTHLALRFRTLAADTLRRRYHRDTSVRFYRSLFASHPP